MNPGGSFLGAWDDEWGPATKADNFGILFFLISMGLLIDRVGSCFIVLLLHTLVYRAAIHTLYQLGATSSHHLLSTTLQPSQQLSQPKSFIMMSPVMGRGGYNAPANRPCQN